MKYTLILTLLNIAAMHNGDFTITDKYSISINLTESLSSDSDSDSLHSGSDISKLEADDQYSEESVLDKECLVKPEMAIPDSVTKQVRSQLPSFSTDTIDDEYTRLMSKFRSETNTYEVITISNGTLDLGNEKFRRLMHIYDKTERPNEWLNLQRLVVVADRISLEDYKLIYMHIYHKTEYQLYMNLWQHIQKVISAPNRISLEDEQSRYMSIRDKIDNQPYPNLLSHTQKYMQWISDFMKYKPTLLSIPEKPSHKYRVLEGIVAYNAPYYQLKKNLYNAKDLFRSNELIRENIITRVIFRGASSLRKLISKIPYINRDVFKNHLAKKIQDFLMPTSFERLTSSHVKKVACIQKYSGFMDSIYYISDPDLLNFALIMRGVVIDSNDCFTDHRQSKNTDLLIRHVDSISKLLAINSNMHPELREQIKLNLLKSTAVDLHILPGDLRVFMDSIYANLDVQGNLKALISTSIDSIYYFEDQHNWNEEKVKIAVLEYADDMLNILKMNPNMPSDLRSYIRVNVLRILLNEGHEDRLYRGLPRYIKIFILSILENLTTQEAIMFYTKHPTRYSQFSPIQHMPEDTIKELLIKHAFDSPSYYVHYIAEDLQFFAVAEDRDEEKFKIIKDIVESNLATRRAMYQSMGQELENIPDKYLSDKDCNLKLLVDRVNCKYKVSFRPFAAK